MEGTKIGGITDVDGNFQITGVPASAKFVVVTYLGAKEKKVAIADVMKITVGRIPKSLKELLLPVCRKWTSECSPDLLRRSAPMATKLDGMADISRSLEGKVAGVSVRTCRAPSNRSEDVIMVRPPSMARLSRCG